VSVFQNFGRSEAIITRVSRDVFCWAKFLPSTGHAQEMLRSSWPVT